MVPWAKTHLDELKLCSITATGMKIMAACPELDIHLVKSGPLGGDQQIGAMDIIEHLGMRPHGHEH